MKGNGREEKKRERQSNIKKMDMSGSSSVIKEWLMSIHRIFEFIYIRDLLYIFYQSMLSNLLMF